MSIHLAVPATAVGAAIALVAASVSAGPPPAAVASLRSLQYELTGALDSVLNGDVGGIWSNDLIAGLGHDTDVALVLGPTGIPQPSDEYLQAAYNLYLSPSGIYDGDVENVYSLWTPEEATNTAAGLAADAHYLEQALIPLLENGNDVTLFGYSQSTAAISMVLNDMAADPEYAQYVEQISFVMVGDSASQYGILANMHESMPSWMQSILLANASAWGLDQGVMHLGADNPAVTITADSPYDGAVYTLMNGGSLPFPDGYAWWEPNSFDTGAWLSQLLGLFTTHQLYLGLTPDDVGNAVLQSSIDSVSYYGLYPDEGFLELLIRSAADVGWLPQSIAEFMLGIGF